MRSFYTPHQPVIDWYNMASQQVQNTGTYIATSNVWELQQLQETDISAPAFKELLVRLFQNTNNMALAVNGKDAGIYHTDEFVNGQTFFPNPNLNSMSGSKPTERQVYRKVINFGALPNNATKTVAHGLTINSSYSFTRIYGAATNVANGFYIPLPYASSTASDIIELLVDNTNVNLKTVSDMSAYTTCYVILEYLKS